MDEKNTLQKKMIENNDINTNINQQSEDFKFDKEQIIVNLFLI